MPEHVQACVYESHEAGKTVKSVVFQPESEIAARMFGLSKSTALPGFPTAEEWRRAVRQELGGDYVEFALGDRRIVVRDGHEQLAEQQNPSQDRVPVDTGGFYTNTGLLELISRENQTAFDLLVRQLRSPMGVVPFVGAGLSVPFGFPQWSKFLTDASEFHGNPERVLEVIAKGDYIGAANLLWEESPDRFQMRVANAFGMDVSPEQTRTDPVGLLPELSDGPVITTNFDHVLETAFRAAGSPFDNIITGPQPDNLIGAMHRNEHVLIKMHGDASDRSARVFTGREYGVQYAKTSESGNSRPQERPATISQLALILFTNRPLLFLGCSLDRDRTLDVLRDIKRDLPGLNHYAILAAAFGINRHRKRRLELDEYGVSPLWFYPGAFFRITSLLQELIQEASTRVVWKPARSGAPPAPPGTGLPGSPPHEPAAVFVNYEPSAVPDELATTLKRIARRIITGRMVFFLGAGVHLSDLLAARGFYEALASDYNLEQAYRADIAQYMVDLEGRAEAWATAKQRLNTTGLQPSAVFQFLVQLPKVLLYAGKGALAYQWILTTNYDVMLENVFEANGEPFHLLYYQADGPDEGRFLHRSPDRVIRAIERPQNVRLLERAHVIVKLDGGVAADEHLPESVAISPMDFAVSAGRLPTALPHVVRDALRSRSLLVLGSSLEAVHVQRLIRWSTEGTCTTKTWAIQNKVTPDAQRYWAAARVSLQLCELADFMPALWWHVSRQLRHA